MLYGDANIHPENPSHHHPKAITAEATISGPRTIKVKIKTITLTDLFAILGYSLVMNKETFEEYRTMQLSGRVSNFRFLIKYVQACLFLFILLTLAGCSSPSDNSSLKPRTQAEEEAITNSWYPIKNKECQLLVDSLNLIGAAIGGNDLQYLAGNMEEIKRNLEQAGQITSIKVLELSLTTQEPSIKEWALEAVPILASASSMITENLDDTAAQIEYLIKLRNLTDRVPDACKS